MAKANVRKNVINFLNEKYNNVSCIIKALKENDNAKEVIAYKAKADITEFTPKVLLTAGTGEEKKFCKLVKITDKTSEKTINSFLKVESFLHKDKKTQKLVFVKYGYKVIDYTINDFFASIESRNKEQMLKMDNDIWKDSIRRDEELFNENKDIADKAAYML